MDRRGSHQLPLDLGHRPGLTRDDLIVTAANAQAVAHVEQWPDWPSPVTILAGPAGSGKTHLAGIWARVAGAVLVKPATIAAPMSTPVLIDDVDVPDLDQTGLFHLINQVRAHGSSMLLTATRFPGAWGVTLPDLASRLKAAALVEIGEPDDNLLQGVIAKLFADRQVEVEPHVVQFVARRIERSLAAANAVVDRLDRAALQGKTRITRALAAEIVAGLDEGQKQLDL